VQECDHKLLSYSRLDEKPPPGQYIYIDVTDSGCGMDKETQQRIFEPFYTTKFTGRGLGMASVMGIIKAHKGAILLYSEPGLGSTFKVLLPISAGTDNGALNFPAKNLDQYHIPKGMVLVVDDEEYVREVCREYLSEIGLISLSAENGSEALDIFKRHLNDIPLIILDLTMPQMDGVATLRELRRLKPDIKVIVSSGHATQASAENFSTDMPDGFIQKPFQLQELREIINNLFKDQPQVY
jgi:CheY-like chemotaxis protein